MNDDSIQTQMYHRLNMKYRRTIDKYMLHTKTRWSVTSILLVFYLIRVITTESYIVVTYIMGLFIMQQILKFYTPLGLPTIEDEDEEFNYDIILPSQLGTSNDRPLLRTSNEITLWEEVTWGIILALLATNFIVFDLPVYWPFLLFYFIMLIIMTFKKQIRHMQKYGYQISDFGKNKKNSNQR